MAQMWAVCVFVAPSHMLLDMLLHPAKGVIALQYVHGVTLRHHFQRVLSSQLTQLLQHTNDLCEAGPLIRVRVHASHPQFLHR